ncbi:CD302 antigen-like isoform X1 [Hypanus sabinus]|uniref:CD302 antigen-like isoform X1 n=1 Tax=Hypanus sabinus TaxID=79690 RepID=UPI0028C3D5FF|nr:CD302 antigen-like isoform X1 [Hypanus sabinus]
MDVKTLAAFGIVFLSAFCLFSASSANIPGCGVTWIPFENKWYSFFPTQGSGYEMEKAQEYCKDIGANIVSVLSETENKFIVDQLKKNMQSKTIWLGMIFDTDTDTFIWFDQSAVNYSNWDPGEPTEESNVDTCAVMGIESGKWKTVKCDEFRSSVMCETTTLAIPDGEKCTNGKNILPTVLVITVALILMVISLVTWYAYKKKYLCANGFSSILYNAADQITDNSILVENEEREYEA